MKHLSDEQFAARLIGEYKAETERHLDACPGCRAEVEALKQTLSSFRTAVHEAPVPAIRTTRQPPTRYPLHWAVLAAVAAALLIAVPLETRHRRHAAEQAALDAQLLKQVDVEISRAVPATMEPLAKIVAWGEGQKQ